MTRFLVVLLGAIALSGAAPAVASASPIGAVSESASKGLSFSGYTWHVYKSGRWTANHTSVRSDTLNLLVSGHKGGGVSMNLNKVYGSWKVRFRMTAGAGSKYVILLWPARGNRPEIDFAEDNIGDAGRRNLNGTFHPRPGCSGCTHLRTGGNFTTWHTVGLVWRPGSLSFTLDGRTWAHLSASVRTPMHLAIQSTSYAGGPSATLQIASVHVS